MPLNTFTVATAVTPSVIETYFSHFFHKRSLRSKPTAHISYHEGLRLVREFLAYASKHTVEELQAFTAQWVPAPTWVRTKDCEVAPQFMRRAANIINAQLGPQGIKRVGGNTWWQWRRPESPLRAEWIEMKKDDHERQKLGVKCDRVIFYIHGGAYFFGSVDEHRYQMQRHARKLKARLLAPRYRLAPQFPFPCGLQDCLASYLYLLEHFPAQQIVCMGDSAGGGMVLSLLVTARDQGLPLPAGVVLLSPWVDLTHSFPSVAGDGELDYIPPHGFFHRPSMAWPPPPSEKVEAEKDFPSFAVELPAESMTAINPITSEGDTKDQVPAHDKAHDETRLIPGIGSSMLSIKLDGQLVELKDQIQMYTTNELLSFPLVSPVMQPSLGGLPPMLIQVGGGELLRDEQIYIAHKAANPTAYPPNEHVLNEFDPRREYLNRYPPTYVQLQVWDDLCHVPHTLSFTSPAKYMYRSVAQFGAWALAHAQQKGIDIPHDIETMSLSSNADTEDEANGNDGRDDSTKIKQTVVGRAGDPIPPFKNHMVRQRVDRHGVIYDLKPEAEFECLHLNPSTIGQIKPGPVRKWFVVKRMNDKRYSKDKTRITKLRARELATGYDSVDGETPPPTALVNRRRNGSAPEEKKRSKRSWGLSLWSEWGSRHDEEAIRVEKKMKDGDGNVTASQNGSIEPENMSISDGRSSLLRVPYDTARRRASSATSRRSLAQSRSQSTRTRPQSAYRQIVDEGQAGGPVASSLRGAISSRRLSTAVSMTESRPNSAIGVVPAMYVDSAAPTTAIIAPDSAPIPGAENTYLDPNSQRPHNGVAAYPFTLRRQNSNPSVMTLDSLPAGPDPSSPGPGTPRGVAEPFGGAVELPTTLAVELPTPLDEKRVEDHNDGELSSSVDEQYSSTANLHTSATGSAGGDLLRPIVTQPRIAVSPLIATSNSPDISYPDETPVSPIEPSPSAFQAASPVFSNRSSIIGRIGADGMPFIPLSHPSDRQASSAWAPSPIVASKAAPAFDFAASTDDIHTHTHTHTDGDGEGDDSGEASEDHAIGTAITADEPRSHHRPPLETFVTAPEPDDLLRQT